MRKLSLKDYYKLRRLVFRNANALMITRWRYSFENGSADDIIDVLSCYQNEDGGFGNGLDGNCLNPNSSPYITSMAVGIIEQYYQFTDKNHPVLQGILRYLASDVHATENGWLGMASIPSNNDYSHAPWFHYLPEKAMDELDPRTLVNFLLKYAEKDSKLYQKALSIDKCLPKGIEKTEPDFSNYNPSEFICWEPLPTDVVDSPDSPLYDKYKDLVEAELDGIIDRLEKIQCLPYPGIDDNPEWLDIPQIISCYPSPCAFFIMQLEILEKFNRLDFTLPIN